MLLSIAYAMAQAPQGQAPAQGNLLQGPIFLFGSMFLIMYFLIIRPQQKQQKEHKLMLENLKKNDEVITNGGIHGTIVNVKDSTFMVRVDDNVKLEISKSSITKVTKQKGTE